MSKRFPIVTFDRLFERIDRPAIVNDFADYSCIGVRLEGRGAYVRQVRPGVDIKRKTQSVVRAGDILYNKLFAWRGAFAVADSLIDGCIASDKFPLYRHDPTQIDPRYLAYWFKCRDLASAARRHSKGAAALSKLTLNPPDFWKLWIPLPDDLEEQRHIVSRLDRLFAAIDEIGQMRRPIDAVVQGRRAGVGSEARLLMTAALERMNNYYKDQLGILDDVLELRPRSGPSFPCSGDGTGTAVVMPSALGGYRYDPAKAMFASATEDVRSNDLLMAGDLLISRGNKRDQVGLCVVYPGDVQPRTHANLLMKMRVKEGIVPEFAKLWIMSPLAVQYIRAHTKGTSPSVQKINQRALINMPFPKDTPVPKQEEWVSWLRSVFDRVEAIEGRIRDQFIDLQDLPHSIMSAVFRGDRPQ